jgi:hypothetical protein
MKWGYFTYGKSIPSIDSFTDGANILVVCSPTDYISKAVSLEDLGWEVRDCIKSLLRNKTLQIGLFRKRFKGTVASNVLTNGCGGLNIDATRISHSDPDIHRKTFSNPAGLFTNPNREGERGAGPSPTGRFPANLILSQYVVNGFNQSSGDCKTGAINPYLSGGSNSAFIGKDTYCDFKQPASNGGASRFFYNFKNESEMKSYLIKLVMV